MKLHQLWIVVLCVGFCHTLCGGQEAQRRIILRKAYLVIPIENKADACPMTISLGDELVTCATVELARDKVDFWTFVDLRQYTGQTVILTAKNPPRGFHAIHSSDCIPGAENLYNEKYRPQFHFSSKRGWHNDSNGLVYYKGEYHLFYQHNPYGIQWGNMTWGQAVSRDLVHWQELPDAIHPDATGNIHSGSGVVDRMNTSGLQKGDDKVLILFYTAAGGRNLWSTDEPFTQAMVYSTDAGRTWTKYENNPIVEHIQGRNRDPKVIWHEPSRRWIMALYLDKNDYVLLGSEDLANWTRLSTITMPGVAECPDFFEMPLDGAANRSKWVFWGGNGKYLVGDFDGTTFTPETEPLRSEWGTNCYAGQTWSDVPETDGRRLWIGWMRGGKYPGMPFNQQMTFARELTLHQDAEGPRLHIRPAREIENIRGRHFSKRNTRLRPGDNPLAELGGDLLEIRTRLKLGSAQEIHLGLGSVTMEYDATSRNLSCLNKSALLSPMEDQTLELHVLVDRTSVEIFANQGRVAMSFCVLPEQLQGGFSLLAHGGEADVSELDVYHLRSIWPQSKEPSAPEELESGHFHIRTDLSTIGHDPALDRQDPSDVLRGDDRYYVWYTQRQAKTHAYASTIYYVVSQDGLHWQNKGQALGKGAPGEWDSFGVITPYVAAVNGKYYLYYTGTGDHPFRPETLRHIGMAVADRPDGPWQKFSGNPVLSATTDPQAYDSLLVDDAHLLVRNGMYWLYRFDCEYIAP
ncbi:MAG TPA: GH32 C-terminal domain-containing protein [Sedimentisphaerales bacterium]|nr:GH32 C-terminal domain-containing protein [Sedimentisphaerales bacterium]